MKKWKVVYTEMARSDLRGIFDYISYTLLATQNAKTQTKHIMDSIVKLEFMPMRCPLYEKEPWCSKGLRMLPVDNYLVFYLPNEAKNIVAIIRIMYGGRNIEEQLNNLTDIKK